MSTKKFNRSFEKALAATVKKEPSDDHLTEEMINKIVAKNLPTKRDLDRVDAIAKRAFGDGATGYR